MEQIWSKFLANRLFKWAKQLAEIINFNIDAFKTIVTPIVYIHCLPSRWPSQSERPLGNACHAR